MSEYVEEILHDEPEGELVHWMEPRPMTVGPAGVSVAAAGAFALGALAALAAVALTHRLAPRRELAAPRWARLH